MNILDKLYRSDLRPDKDCPCALCGMMHPIRTMKEIGREFYKETKEGWPYSLIPLVMAGGYFIWLFFFIT